MRSFITILVISCFTTALASCSGGGTAGNDPDDGNGGHVNNPSDIIAPVLNVYTPTENQVFSNGNTIAITGRTTDENGLYRGSIRVINDENGAVLKEQLIEIHGLLGYNFAINYTASVTAVSNYTVTVTFEDHGYNAVTKSVKIKVNP